MRPRARKGAKILRSARRPKASARLVHAMTLLETVLAMTLMSVISLLGAQSVRITWQAWELQDLRSDAFQHLHGALSHITRHVRSARNVVSLSAATDTSGYLSITRPDDTVVKWDHNGSNDRIFYGTADPPTDLLALGIDELKFECFEIDGVTPTTVPADVRMIRTTVGITVPGQGVPLSLVSTVWIRKQLDGLAAEFVDFYPTNHSGGASWQDKNNLFGPPDGVLSYGIEGARVEPYDCDTTGYADADPVGTVLIGFYLMTDTPLGEDVFTVQLKEPAVGLVHSFGESALLRFENNMDWFWVDLTDDFAGWTYADVNVAKVKIFNQNEGAGGSTIRLDSVKIRTFEESPLTQSFWLTSAGTAFNEWVNQPSGLGPLDGAYTNSTIFSVAQDDVDRQDYFYTPSWEDLGTIVRVRLLIPNFYVSATLIDDEFHARMPTTTEPAEPSGGLAPAPNTAQLVPITLLNEHVGSANSGSMSLDFTNLEAWTWPGLRSRFVRLYMSAIGSPEAEIYVDAVSVEVRYVPPISAAIVLWEEL